MNFIGKIIRMGKDYGVIIPDEIVKKMNIKVGEWITLDIHKIKNGV